MKIYTKTGDKGETSLFGGTRVPKYDDRIESYGTVDELNAYIGLIRAQKITVSIKEDLLTVQNDLFTLGAMLATPKEKETLKSGKKRLNIPRVNQSSILNLENQIDLINKDLEPMTNFILPGGDTTISYCHIARCVCRRAERLVVKLSTAQTIDNNVIMYLNRLSDYLFILARKLTLDNQVTEIPWKPQKK